MVEIIIIYILKCYYYYYASLMLQKCPNKNVSNSTKDMSQIVSQVAKKKRPQLPQSIHPNHHIRKDNH